MPNQRWSLIVGLPLLCLVGACDDSGMVQGVEEGPRYGDSVTNELANEIGYGNSPNMMPSETGAPGASGNATARGDVP